MVAKKYDIEPSHIRTYQEMIGKGLLRNLMRVRARTLCNSRQFKQGVAYCPIDNQVLSIYHITGHCPITNDWRAQAARMLRCEEKDILKQIGSREVLKRGNPYTRLGILEAICKPLAAIQEAAKKGDRNWICPPIGLPQLPPRNPHRKRKIDERGDIHIAVDTRPGANTGHVPFGPRPLPRQAQLAWARQRE